MIPLRHERAERGGQISDNRVLVARDIPGVAVLQDPRVRRAERLRGAHDRNCRTATACVLRKRSSSDIKPSASKRCTC